MQVRVRFISFLSSQLGASEVEVILPETARVGDLVNCLQHLYPPHAALLTRVTFMVNQKNALPETELFDGAQVLALITLSGG